nr:DnaA/Hda family protein [Caldimonas sp.]
MKQIPLAMGPEPARTFENFLAGANAAAVAHLRSLAPGAPPVYLWGPPGSGKTHLLHAIVERAASQGRHAAWHS